MFMYDTATFCTPLAMLQIPKAAIQQITARVQEGGVSVTHYTQDSSTLAELSQGLEAEDARLTRETSLDVGFICSKCHMVFPAQDACVSHQQMVCYQGKSAAELHKCMVKLEQRQYECAGCGAVASTLHEYKAHCQHDSHRNKITAAAAHHSHQQAAASSSSSSSSSPRAAPLCGKEAADAAKRDSNLSAHAK